MAALAWAWVAGFVSQSWNSPGRFGRVEEALDSGVELEEVDCGGDGSLERVPGMGVGTRWIPWRGSESEDPL